MSVPDAFMNRSVRSLCPSRWRSAAATLPCSTRSAALPGPGLAVLYSYCAQYRYKGEPFGQHSPWVTHSVHG